MKVYPMVLTYELGLDSPALYQWTASRCAEEGLLESATPLTFCDIDTFESLLSLGTHGISVFTVLDAQHSGARAHERLSIALDDFVTDRSQLRLPELATRFEAISHGVRTRLFRTKK